ncbi:uncharacterized protein LOC143234413 isoform X2 [Tachypleus tridentatus]|uniref:uncharacterized protein LOC143234413 isoform X2 n=1 Tax=Tachypleus tridentatus TaxID=6853 RepID=UPI003FD5503E
MDFMRSFVRPLGSVWTEDLSRGRKTHITGDEIQTTGDATPRTARAVFATSQSEKTEHPAVLIHHTYCKMGLGELFEQKKHPRTNMVSVKCICPTSEPESKADRRRRETGAKSGSVNPKQKRDRHRKIRGRVHPVSGPQGDVVLPEDEEDIRTSIRR